MKLEEMVLRDGQRLVDIWPAASDLIEEDETVAFISIPEGKNGTVFIEHGDGENRLVALYRVFRSGASDFVAGITVRRRNSG